MNLPYTRVVIAPHGVFIPFPEGSGPELHANAILALDQAARALAEHAKRKATLTQPVTETGDDGPLAFLVNGAYLGQP